MTIDGNHINTTHITNISTVDEDDPNPFLSVGLTSGHSIPIPIESPEQAQHFIDMMTGRA